MHPCGYTQTSLKTYLFWYNSLLLCFAIFISCYINKFLYAKSFQPFHPQFFRCSVFSGPPYILDKRFLYLDNCIFILILLYFLVFALVLKTVDIALVKFSFWQFKMMIESIYFIIWLNQSCLILYCHLSFCFLACFCSCLLPLSSSFLNSAPHRSVWCGALFFIVLTYLIFQGDIYCLFNSSFIWLRCKGNKRELIRVSKNMI